MNVFSGHERDGIPSTRKEDSVTTGSQMGKIALSQNTSLDGVPARSGAGR
jgi:hypothetical protein